MNLGLVMFGKAVIIGIAVIALERWQSFKKQRIEAGIELKLNPKTGRYEPSNWPETFEFWFKRIFWTAVALITISSFALTAFIIAPEIASRWE